VFSGFFFTSSVGHYKKVTLYLKKRDVRRTKETNIALHHAHSDIHYVCKYIIACHFFSKVFQLEI
jgi:hypothetical protein